MMFWLSFLSSAVEKRLQRRFLEEDWLKKREKVYSKTDVFPSIYRYHTLYTGWMVASFLMRTMCYLCAENTDITSALSKLTEPSATVPIHKLSVSNMVHSARKHIRRHRHVDESPLNTAVLNSIMLVRVFHTEWKALKPLNVFLLLDIFLSL